jgi:hypothetical protein
MNIPAFPAPVGVSHITEQGMTLRDYFAAQSIQIAMQMVKHDLKLDDENFYWCEVHREIIAKRSYQLADAMLEARGE